VTNTFTLLRLLPMSARDKDIEILTLRHQLLVLQRQVGKPAFTDTDRMVLASLLHRLPRQKLRQLLLLVRPDTILRWHRDLLKQRHAATCAPKRPGRPRTLRSIRVLVLRLARENPNWGYRRLHGELLVLGVKVAASTVWEILHQAGIDPAPERSASTWAEFLRSQADALLACDFLECATRRCCSDGGERPSSIRRRSGGLKLGAVVPEGRRERREQPRQSRDGPALPDGPGTVSETGRYTRETGVVTPLEVAPARTRWIWAVFAVRTCPLMWVGNSWSGL
jgi:transposase